MKKTGIIALTTAILVQVSLAHPAKEVELSLNDDTLTVTADHAVRNASKHYIKEITISIGDSLILAKNYSEQTSKESLIDTFLLPKDLLIEGETIYVETVCNKFGTKVGQLTIGKGEE